MNPLDQYTSLYRNHRDTINTHSPQALNNLRECAMSCLEGAVLPQRGDEGYHYTSLSDMFAPDLGINITRINFAGDTAAAFRHDVPSVTAAPIIVTNDFFDPGQPALDRMPQGVTVCPFAMANEKCPGVLDRFYGNVAECCANTAVALNTLLVQDGVLVHVARGTKASRPVQIVHLLSATQPILAVRRVLVVLEADASLDLVLCDHTHPQCAPSTSSTVVEIDLAPGANLNLCDLEESAAQTSRQYMIAANIDAAANLHLAPVTLTCGKTRNDIVTSLNAPDAHCSLHGMAITSDSQIADMSSTVLHHTHHCTSNQLVKYVADGESRAAFEGLIKVFDGAHHTEAAQSNRNIVASPLARIHTQPQLEIYCDDVKCSHGAATGSLDERALFYMQSRGIPRSLARNMLMQAFMADVLDNIAIEPLKQRLRQLVERRLGDGLETSADADALCDKCRAC